MALEVRRAAFSSEEERLRSFGDAIDAIRKREEADLGAQDIAEYRRMDRFSNRMRRIGRVLIFTSFEPVGFFVGVTALWIHKQIQAEEIGHSVLHGVFDHLEDAPEYHRANFKWDSPVDPRIWRRSHVATHHPNPNMQGRDDNFTFGPVRINELTEHRWYHRVQLPVALFGLFPVFSYAINAQMAGMEDLFFRDGKREKFVYLEDRSLRTVADCLWKLTRTAGPYCVKNFVFHPMLAGPFFPKVLAANVLAEVIRDCWIGATIFSNHIVDVAVYPEGLRPRTKGEYYVMQAEASHNFRCSLPVSILSGGLDCHIEHHLFPSLPARRLRRIREEVRAVCEAHDVRYLEESSWARLLFRSFARIHELSRETDAERERRAPLRARVARWTKARLPSSRGDVRSRFGGLSGLFARAVRRKPEEAPQGGAFE